MPDFDAPQPVRSDFTGQTSKDLIAKIGDGTSPLTQQLKIDANGRTESTISDPTTPAQKLKVNADGSINANLVTALSGGEVHDYNTAASIAAGATSNHDYTVTAATTLKLHQIIVSSAGKIKAELQVKVGGTFQTRAVRFAMPKEDIDLAFKMPIEVSSAETAPQVRIIRTNLDNQATDLYSTIVGDEIA